MIKMNVDGLGTTAVRAGITATQIYRGNFSSQNPRPYLAIYNHQYVSLETPQDKPGSLTFIYEFNAASRRAYENAAILVLALAAAREYPAENLEIQHSMCDGLYCEFTNRTLATEEIQRLFAQMKTIIQNQIPITPVNISPQTAPEFLENNGVQRTADLLQQSNKQQYTIYHIDDHSYWLPSPPVSHTGFLKAIRLQKHKNGFVLRLPRERHPNHIGKMAKQARLYDIFDETIEWAEILGITHVSQINQLVQKDKISDLIKICEALHEKKISRIADKIAGSRKHRRFVFISGPSSSGKTTFMKRLYIHLRVLGYRVATLSLDNYYKDRDRLRHEQGPNMNFEVIEALDLDLLNRQLQLLLEGQSIQPPQYNFTSGRKNFDTEPLTADNNTLVLIEGIHGINPQLTTQIDESFKFKIYISALTHLNLDDINRIPTHDTRLIRRIIRDSKHRDYDASRTIDIWKKVVSAEKEYIFTFQGQADIMFNSSLPYEIGVLKKYAEPLLRKVREDDPGHPEAARLLDFLGYFRPIEGDEIPPTSILREFIGNSSFR